MSKILTEKDSILSKRISSSKQQVKDLTAQHTQMTTWYDIQVQQNDALQNNIRQLTTRLHYLAHNEKLKAKLPEKHPVAGVMPEKPRIVQVG